MKSRHASAAATSTAPPVTAASFAARSASPGRTSVLDGMQPQ
jgi:hypothetical protein